MTEAKQPEALRLASVIEQFGGASVYRAAAELRRQYGRIAALEYGRISRIQQNDRMAARIAELERQLVAEAAKTAAEKLRADQMTEQHRMQAAMHAQAMERPRQCLHGISEPSGWRPIETAPKNGQCLVWCETDDGGEVMKLQRDVRGNWIYEGEPTYCHSFYINPTRWMPLPPSPSSADEGGSK